MSNTANLDLERPDRGAAGWHTSLNSNMTKIDTTVGSNSASISDLPQVYIETGTFNFTTGDVITLPVEVDAINEYSVAVTPTTGVGGDIGFIYITKTTTNFTVHCSANNTTDTFAAAIYYIGDIASYGGSIYRRWYVSTNAAITDHGDTADTGSFAWILDQIGANQATVELPGNKAYTIQTTVTVPANINLIFQKGAVLTDDANNADITINGTIAATPSQRIFNWGNGSGSVSFGGLIYEIFVEWMGDIDGVADDVQINEAIAAASVNQKVKVYDATYTCSSSIALNKSITLEIGATIITSTADPAVAITANDVTIKGINRKESQIKNTTATESVIRSVGAARSGITIENLYLEGAASVYGAQTRESEQLIWFGDTPEVGAFTDITIRNCHLTQSLNGILFQFVNDSKIINNTFSHSNAGLRQVNLWSCDRVEIQGNTFIDTSAGMVNAIEVLNLADDPCFNIIIKGNTFTGAYLETINFVGAKSIISENTIYHTGGADHQAIQLIQADNNTACVVYENIVSNNNIHISNAAGGYAISLKDDGDNYGVKRNIISNNIIKYNGASAVFVNTGQNIDDNVWESNTIIDSGNGLDGIYLSGATCSGTIFRNNQISGCGRYGITSNLSEELTVEGNKITGCAQDGIYIIGGSNHIVINNKSYSNTTYGIRFSTGAGVKRFFGNLAYSNGTADVTKGTAIINTEILTGVITIDSQFESAYIDSSGGAVTATLGAGLYIGQVKTIVMTDATTSSTVTVTNHDNIAGIPILDGGTPSGDGEIGTFDAVDEAWILIWTGTEWTTLRATCTF